MGWWDVHLWVKDTHRCFDYAHGLIKHHLRKHLALTILQDRCNVQPQILRVQLRRERVGQTLPLSCRDLHAISLRCQVAHDLRWIRGSRSIEQSGQRAADYLHGYGGGLVVGDIEDGAGGMVVDQFDPEDFGLWEGRADLDGEGRRLKFRFVAEFSAFGDLLDVFDLKKG